MDEMQLLNIKDIIERDLEPHHIVHIFELLNSNDRISKTRQQIGSDRWTFDITDIDEEFYDELRKFIDQFTEEQKNERKRTEQINQMKSSLI